MKNRILTFAMLAALTLGQSMTCSAMKAFFSSSSTTTSSGNVTNKTSTNAKQGSNVQPSGQTKTTTVQNDNDNEEYEVIEEEVVVEEEVEVDDNGTPEDSGQVTFDDFTQLNSTSYLDSALKKAATDQKPHGEDGANDGEQTPSGDVDSGSDGEQTPGSDDETATPIDYKNLQPINPLTTSSIALPSAASTHMTPSNDNSKKTPVISASTQQSKSSKNPLYKNKYSGIIVILNGASSAGKSSLVAALLNAIQNQEKQDTNVLARMFDPDNAPAAMKILNPWGKISIDDDDIVDEIEEKELQENIQAEIQNVYDNTRKHPKKWILNAISLPNDDTADDLSIGGMTIIHKIKQLMRMYPTHNIIVDTILKTEDFDDVDGFYKAFENMDKQMCMILVECDPHNLVSRAISRTENAVTASDSRNASTSLKQHAQLFTHTPSPTKYAHLTPLTLPQSSPVSFQCPTTTSDEKRPVSTLPKETIIAAIKKAHSPDTMKTYINKDNTQTAKHDDSTLKLEKEYKQIEAGTTASFFPKSVSTNDPSPNIDIFANVRNDLTVTNNDPDQQKEAVKQIIKLINDRFAVLDGKNLNNNKIIDVLKIKRGLNTPAFSLQHFLRLNPHIS